LAAEALNLAVWGCRKASLARIDDYWGWLHVRIKMGRNKSGPALTGFWTRLVARRSIFLRATKIRRVPHPAAFPFARL